MNRNQAENILDAYVLLYETNAVKATDALREVILDAMTSVRYYPITYPNITTSPSTVPYKPNVTWRADTNPCMVNTGGVVE